MRGFLATFLVFVVGVVCGCGGGGGGGGGGGDGGNAATSTLTQKAADFTSDEVAGKTLYLAVANSGRYEAYTCSADGTVSAHLDITAGTTGTALSGTWRISSGLLLVDLTGKGTESYTKISATADSYQSFTIIGECPGTATVTAKLFINQLNGDDQALACATGAAIPAPAVPCTTAMVSGKTFNYTFSDWGGGAVTTGVVTFNADGTITGHNITLNVDLSGEWQVTPIGALLTLFRPQLSAGTHAIEADLMILTSATAASFVATNTWVYKDDTGYTTTGKTIATFTSST